MHLTGSLGKCMNNQKISSLNFESQGACLNSKIYGGYYVPPTPESKNTLINMVLVLVFTFIDEFDHSKEVVKHNKL